MSTTTTTATKEEEERRNTTHDKNRNKQTNKKQNKTRQKTNKKESVYSFDIVVYLKQNTISYTTSQTAYMSTALTLNTQNYRHEF